jgi:hypothetical protein
LYLPCVNHAVESAIDIRCNIAISSGVERAFGATGLRLAEGADRSALGLSARRVCALGGGGAFLGTSH